MTTAPQHPEHTSSGLVPEEVPAMSHIKPGFVKPRCPRCGGGDVFVFYQAASAPIIGISTDDVQEGELRSDGQPYYVCDHCRISVTTVTVFLPDDE